jgi:hypothetical protein
MNPKLRKAYTLHLIRACEFYYQPLSLPQFQRIVFEVAQHPRTAP